MNRSQKIIISLSLATCCSFSLAGQVFAANPDASSTGLEPPPPSSQSASGENSSSSNSSGSSSISEESTSQSNSLSSPDASSESASTFLAEDPESEIDIAAFSTAQNAGGFVNRLYSLVLQRPTDEGGINYWTQALLDGRPASSIVQFFFSGAEYNSKQVSDEEYVKTLYLTLMNRSADQTGLNHWMKYLSDGMSRDFVLSCFVGSPEFTDICRDYGIARGEIALTQHRDRNSELTYFISRFYVNCLGRTFDEGGLNNWTGGILNGSLTAAGVIEYFFSGPEFSSKKTDDSTFIKTAYRTLLGREADGVGYASWLSDLQKGYSRKYVLCHFVNSPEFTGNCSRIGIPRGDISLSSADYPTAISSPKLTVTMNGTVVTGTREDILAQIVMAEVGGLNNDASYQAQAVAAHSYIVYNQKQGVAAPAVVGKEPTQAVRNAVAPVANIVVQYNGTAAFTPYYASSAGTTNYNSAFWGQSFPYLVQVESHYDVSSDYYRTEKYISRTEFANIMRRVYGNSSPSIDVFMATHDPSQWIVTPGKNNGSLYYNSKYMVSVCGRTPTVEYFYQNIVNIRSAAFDVRYDANSDGFIFTSYGFGHGVGMSQWGAYFFATKEGWNYSQILSHYYPSTSLATI